ncbi:unnamed protein product [Onchocerca flexuosa]|uniref:Uncharacterized protein n=1 Tax=Onchocerca flexuosa TaxID=387005 RepID=A0A183HJH8_9BILA|nr:unnamed protein product [Onchocerca flexuosa]
MIRYCDPSKINFNLNWHRSLNLYEILMVSIINGLNSRIL